MTMTVGELIGWLSGVNDDEKLVKAGVWNKNTNKFENVTDFSGMFISKNDVTIATGVIEEVVE